METSTSKAHFFTLFFPQAALQPEPLMGLTAFAAEEHQGFCLRAQDL